MPKIPVDSNFETTGKWYILIYAMMVSPGLMYRNFIIIIKFLQSSYQGKGVGNND
jgi:hypothetical protein